MAVILTPHKIEGIFSQLKTVKNSSKLTDRTLSKFIGALEVTLSAVEYMW